MRPTRLHCALLIVQRLRQFTVIFVLIVMATDAKPRRR